MSEAWILTLLASTLTLSSPLILASIGGYCSERGGVINIALEGKMLISACVTALVAIGTGNAVLGLLAGLGASVLLAWLHWLLTQAYQIDHIVSGMALNALAFGAANFLDKRFTDPERTEPMPHLPLGFFYALAVVLPVALALYSKHGRGGLRLRAVGGDPEKARLMGVSPQAVRFWGLTAAGVLCGLSGALIVTNARWFTDGMTAGRGFVALAALILGGWRPIPAALACAGIGLFFAVEVQLQGTPILGMRVPPDFWSALPYAMTVIVLAGFLGRSRPPAGLGKP